MAGLPITWNVTAHGPDGRRPTSRARIVAGVGAGERGGWLEPATGDAVASADVVAVGEGTCDVGGMHAAMTRPNASASAGAALRRVMNPTPTCRGRSVDPTRRSSARRPARWRPAIERRRLAPEPQPVALDGAVPAADPGTRSSA